MRNIVASILVFAGFLFVIGAVGTMEYENTIDFGAFFLRIAAGAILMIIAAIIVKGGDNYGARKNLREQNQKISRRK